MQRVNACGEVRRVVDEVRRDISGQWLCGQERERETGVWGRPSQLVVEDEDCSEYQRSPGPGSRWTFKPRLRGGAFPYKVESSY